MKKFVILILLLIPTIANAVAYQSNGTGGGDWSVGASWNPVGVPNAADTVDILAGDIITIDGNNAAGASPAATNVYNIDISGTLRWPANPGANWTFDAYSSVRINNGGVLEIGTSADRLNCSNYAVFQMQTATQAYYIYILDGGIIRARGCVGYHASSGTEIRARIIACSPDCLVGVNRTLTLDRNVNWQMVANPLGGGNDHDVLIGVGGSETAGPLSTDPERRQPSAFPAANQVTTDLNNNHQIGDMILSLTRNILFLSTNALKHGKIYSIGGEIDFSWVEVYAMGNSSSSGAAISFIDNAKNMGGIEYTSIFSCKQGAVAATCLYIDSDSWDAGENNYNIVSNCGNTVGAYLQVSSYDEAIMTIEGWSSFYSDQYCSQFIAYPWRLKDYWASDCANGSYGRTVEMTNAVIHYTGTLHGFYIIGITDGQYRSNLVLIDNAEVRNTAGDGIHIHDSSYSNTVIQNSNFDRATRSCLRYNQSYGIHRLYNNTFDGCNTGDTLNYAGVYIDTRAGRIYAMNNDFGVNAVNNRSNIMYQPPVNTDNYTDATRITFNECALVAPNNAVSSDPIHLYNYPAGSWQRRAFVGPTSYVTIHNRNNVTDSHWGWGPGGMVIERETSIVVDNTLNLKITPFAADRYERVPVGDIWVNSGHSLTVGVRLRKNQAIATAGRRPRLVLEGCGFDPYTAYTEMNDVTNTWQLVQVNGTANAKGVVHVYIEVIGVLSGASYIIPVDPPTLIIYADGVSYRRT